MDTIESQRAAFTAVNRFGMGARPGDPQRIAANPRAWLTGQIEQPEAFQIDDPALPTRQIASAALEQFLQAQRERQTAAPSNESAAQQVAAVATPLRALNQLAAEEALSRTRHALRTDHGFAERLVHFWSNHFTVAATKATTIAWVGLYEREVIRAHACEHFEDMLIAMVQHPGMLLYLDQAQSIGPNSLIGQRRRAGLNENLAREILELHTIGVEAGYSQTDVTELARALTGWTIVGTRTQAWAPNAPSGNFIFIPAMHEPGDRTVLGKRYAQWGEQQALAILRDLARHPATARRVALQLARHFIADEPPAAAVERLAQAYRTSGGHLPTVHRALIDAPEAWSAESLKFKTPAEFLLSSLRLLDQQSIEAAPLRNAINLLGQAPFRAPSPAGWPDRASHWAAPDAIMKRLEWSQMLAERLGRRERPDERLIGALGAQISTATLQAIRRAESQSQGLVLALMSPEFQRR